MPLTHGRRRLTCHHEGGHALARWYFGHRTRSAVVLSLGEVRLGRTIKNWVGEEFHCEGMVDGWQIHSPPFGPNRYPGPSDMTAYLSRCREVSRDIELINCAAGIAAEATYRRLSMKDCAEGGGASDMRYAHAILEAWFTCEDRRREQMSLAVRRATALVRSAAGSRAICAMADALMERGKLDGDEIEALCRRAYGGQQCSFGGWTAQWPPSLSQIRTGFIPEPLSCAA